MGSSFMTDKTVIVDHVFFVDKLKDITFTVQKGEVVGIIGTNDSGINSILDIISGLEKPTSGFVSVLGHDPYLKKSEYLKNISYILNDKNQILRNTAPIESLEITKIIYELSDREFNKNLNDITRFVKDPVLLDALIYLPKIVFLDKTNTDFDSVYEYCKKYDATSLITSEKIDKLINLVRRVIVVDNNQILYDGSLDNMIEKFAPEKNIKAKLLLPIDIKLANEIGVVKKYDYPYLILSGPRSVVSFMAAELMQNFSISNLSIDEIAVEEIVHNIKNDISYKNLV